MGKISLKNFKKLNHSEQLNRYKDLCDYDKYIFRITDPTPFLYAESINHMEITEKQKKEAYIRIKKVQNIINKRLEELYNSNK